MAVDTAYAGAYPVQRAFRRKTGGGGQHGQRGDQKPERPTQNLEANKVCDGSSAKDGQPDHVGEAGRTGVLYWPFPEARLDQLEVDETGRQ